MMLARICILSHVLLLQVFGSRLGSPKHQETKPTGWAWKNSERHAPPGHLAKPKASDGSHAWAGKARHPFSGEKIEATVPEIGTIPRKVIQPDEEDNVEPQSVVKDSVTAKYDTRAEVTSDSASGAGADLQSTLEADCSASMNLAEFMPKCLKHTKSLIADLDYNYGDAQLETILRNWCQSAKEFPLSRGSRKVIGFKDHQSCTDFADDLKNARYLELKSTSDKGYKDFCTAFYAHHGGFSVPPPPPRKEKPARSGASWAGLSMVLLSLVVRIA